MHVVNEKNNLCYNQLVATLWQHEIRRIIQII